MSETQAVQGTVEGLNPAQCSRFVLQSTPQCYADLDELAIHDQNFVCAANPRKDGIQVPHPLMVKQVGIQQPAGIKKHASQNNVT